MIIYLVTNLINGKQYVGQTVQDLKKRWQGHQHGSSCRVLSQAINKYGKDNFKIEVLDKAKTIDDLNTLEIKYINKLNTISPNGYNLQTGGGSYIPHEQTKKLTRASQPTNRPVVDGNGVIYQSINDAARQLDLSAPHIARVCRAEQPATKNHTFKFYDEINIPEEWVEEAKGLLAEARKYNKVVDHNGNVYKTTGHAASKLGLDVRNVSAVCAGTRRSTGGYAFMYIDDTKSSDDLKKQLDDPRLTVIVDQNGKEYSSLEEAATMLDLDSSSISRVISGKLKSTGGYTFKKISDRISIAEMKNKLGFVYSRPIVDQNGVEYPSVKNAAGVLNLQESTIHRIIRGKLKSTGGYSFKEIGDPTPLSVLKKRSKGRSRRIKDQNGIVYDSPTEAANKLGLSRGDLSRVLSGKRNHTKGYTFTYIDED